MTIKPIVYVLGVEGHFYLAEALRNEFKRPVVGIVSSQRVQEMLTPERRAIFDKLYSLPDFYFEQIGNIRGIAPTTLDEEQTALEKELGIASGALLAFYDRTLRELGDDVKIRQWELCNLRFVKKFLAEVQPAFVMCGVVTYLQFALRAACHEHGIPCMLAQHSRARKRDGIAFIQENGQQIGMNRLFESLQKVEKDVLPYEVLVDADAVFNAFLSAPARPGYAAFNSLTGFNLKRFLRKALRALRPDNIFPSERVRKIDRAMNMEYTPVRIARGAAVARMRRIVQSLLGVFDQNPDLSVPFIYLPLHFSPETSDLYFGTLYDHHEGFVTHLAKFIPSHMRLYVKEHTSMLGRRPTSFYRNLNRLRNVSIIDPRVNTFSLITGAAATVTATGTAGWEAFQLGKPAVALGDVFYNFLPGILHCPLDREFTQRLETYLQQFRPKETTRRNGFRACWGSSFAGEKVDFDGLSKRETATKAAQDFARAVREVIARFGNEIGGSFPQDLLSLLPASETRAA